MSKFYSRFASILLLLLVSCNETGVSTSTTPEQTIASIAIEQDMTPQDVVDTLNTRGCIASTSMTVAEFQTSNPGVLLQLKNGGYYYDFTKCGEIFISSSSSHSIPSDKSNLTEITDSEWNTLRYPNDTDMFLYNTFHKQTYIEGIKLTHRDTENVTRVKDGVTLNLISYDEFDASIEVNKDIILKNGQYHDSTAARVEWTCYSKMKPYLTNGDGNDSVSMYFMQSITDSINTGSIEILMNQDVTKEFVLNTKLYNPAGQGTDTYTYKYTFAINDMLSTGIPDSITTSSESIELGYITTLAGFYNGRTVNSFTIRFTSGTVTKLSIRPIAIKIH